MPAWSMPGIHRALSSLHAPPADQNILKGVIQRMADVEGPGHIRWRNDNAIRRTGGGRGGVKQPLFDPTPVPPVFDLFGIVDLFELLSRHA